MLRNGQFDNLQWDTLAEVHGVNWRQLQNCYNLPLQQVDLSIPLDKLAMQAVKSCREYLFTSPGCKEGWQTELAMGVLPINDLEQNLASALCDHLLVTFAYRLFCDNLAHRTLEECLNTIYHYQSKIAPIPIYTPKKDKGGTLKGDKERSRELKDNFIRPKVRSCREYDRKVDAVLSFYQQKINSVMEEHFTGLGRCRWLITNRKTRITSHKQKDTRSRRKRKLDRRKLRLSNYAFLRGPRATEYASEVKMDWALIKKESITNISERYAAPNWMYSIAMACSWTNSPLAMKNKNLVFSREYTNQNSILHRLTKFLGSSQWGPILFREVGSESKRPAYPVKPKYTPLVPPKDMEAEKEIWRLQVSPSLMELRQDKYGYFFVAVPYVHNQNDFCDLPSQSYNICGTSDSYTIPVKVQRLFNSYLVERTFHGYASAVATDRIRERQSSGEFESRYDQYQELPAVVRLRAPLVHPQLIRLADDMIGKSRPIELVIPWLNHLIDYWNRLALPLLEEYFLWSVWSCYGESSVDIILSEVTKALMQNEGQYQRCDCLNFYRLVRVDDNTQKPENDNVLNEVMWNTFRAGLGYKLRQEHGRYIDPGRATVFDGV